MLEIFTFNPSNYQLDSITYKKPPSLIIIENQIFIVLKCDDG